MNARLSNHIGQLARAYWQPLVLAVLILLVVSQVYAWAVAAIELRKVDTLISQTEDTTPPKDGGNSTAEGKPDSPPNGPPQENQESKQPPNNIFKREEINYILSAIYMDKAVINGQDVAVGGKIGNAEVKEIGVWDATIEVDGQTRKLEMYQGGGGDPSSSGPGDKSPSRSGSSRNKSSGRSGSSPAPVQILMSNGARISIQGMSVDQLRNLPPEQRRQMWENASESERQQLRERFGANGGGGRIRGAR